MNRNKIFLFIVILLILSAAGFYIYKDFSSTKNTGKTENEEGLEKLLNDSDNKNNQDFVLKQEQDDSEDNIKILDLSKPATIKADLPQDIISGAIKEISIISNTLKQDYRSVDGWIQLGLLKKLLGDFNGAKEAWEFASSIAPNNSISFHNLGFIYWQHYKDYEKAEQNYLKAVQNNKKDIIAFIDLSNIYYYDLKNSVKARNILMEGLKENPGDYELLRTLNDLK